MDMTTVRIGALAAGVAVSLAAAAPAAASEPWPQRMVRVFVPTGPGSATDMAARIFADRLANRWKQPVVVENRAGADGLIGVSAFAAAHDDHALLFSFAAPMSVYPVVREKLPYDPARDFVPISSATDSFGILAVPGSSKIGSLAELAAAARARPGKLNSYASSGIFPYLLAGFLQSQGLDVTQISYREQNLAMQDLGAGRLDFLMSVIGAVLPLVQDGKARFLAVTNSRRSPIVPDVPTVTEAGYPELAFEGFQGFFGARGMPPELRDRIAADVGAVAADPVLVARLDALAQLARATTPTAFAGMIEDQRAKIADIVRRTGMKQ
jgi:tripartite-type tricarboxylate transporter receptor subunit TctC